MQFSFVTSQSLLLSIFCKTSKNNIFGFSIVFSWKTPGKTVQILIFKVELLENDLVDFDDFGLILQDFERPF